MRKSAAIAAVAGFGATLAAAAVALDRAAAPEPAAALEVIVNRHAEHVEVFMRMPSPAIETLFDGDASAFMDSAGLIEFAQLTNGTWQYGDALFGALRGASEGAALEFEVMSAMFHPAGAAPDFRDPHDAIVAMSVCGVEPPAPFVALDDLVTVVGFFVDAPIGDAPLSFALPIADAQGLTIAVQEFADSAPRAAYAVTLDGAVFTTAPAS